MSKRFKNNKNIADTWAGQIIQPGEYFTIEWNNLFSWQNDSKVLTDIGSGDGIINDGVNDILDVATAINFLKNEDTSPKDADGSQILRTKTTKTGWHYEPRSLDFYTSKYNSLYNRKHDGNLIEDGTDYGDANLKFYNNSGTELTFQQTGFESETAEDFQTRLTNNCVKTIMNWQPTYDMDIIGGILMIKDAPTNPAYVWSIAAPQLSEQYGGSIPFAAGGWNLSFFNSKDTVIINGRGVKTILYDPVYNTNEFSLIIKHEVGIQIGLQMFYEHFKA